METAVVSVAGKLRDDQVPLWFDAVLTAYRASEEDWSRAKQVLADQVAERSLPAEALEAFTEHLDNVAGSPQAVLSELYREGDDLPQLYRDLLVRQQQEQQATPPQMWDTA